MLHNDDRVPLPAGSTLDSENGVFVWQLGPGFRGAYALEFQSASGAKSIRVVVRPPGSTGDFAKQ